MAKNKIKNAQHQELYMQLTDSNTALTSYSEALSDNEGIKRSSAGSVGRTFEDYDGSMSVRSSYHRGDYEWFRGAETIPKKPKDIINSCNRAYERIGIVKNIIDLMAEFTVSGIRIQHSDKNIENFYRIWSSRVKFEDRSERFVNLLYRLANVVVCRKNGTLSQLDMKKMKQAKSKKGDDIILKDLKVFKRQVPLQYIFQNVSNLEVTNEDWALVTGEPFEFSAAINPSSITDSQSIVVRGPRKTNREYMRKLPPEIRKAYQENKRTYPLDIDKTRSFYYKKDDWQVWAKPMTYSILADLIMYEKLKLSDVCAADGVISNVRLWRLGYINESNPVHSILPTKAGINRLRAILHKNVGGGTLDLVWGPELDFKDSSTDAHKWLGKQKYEPTLDAIYDGIGIPPTLRSSSGGTSTGNVIGLQTLIERLEYGRQILLDFWYHELKLVHKAMGFPSRLPKITFDQMILADRAAERQLAINLADRDIISYQAVKEMFGYHPDIEDARVKIESKRRGTMSPYKASPFHNPDKEHEYKKILLQSGTAAPSEIGFKLDPKKKGEMNRFEQMKKFAPSEKYKPTGTVKDGRPKNVKETKKRKPKPKEKPSTNAFIDCLIWATRAQETINQVITPAILKEFGKSDLRGLTKDEFDRYENLKFVVLSNLTPYSKVDENIIKQTLENGSKGNVGVMDIARNLEEQIFINRKPKVEELRQLYVNAYSTYYTGENDGGN